MYNLYIYKYINKYIYICIYILTNIFNQMCFIWVDYYSCFVTELLNVNWKSSYIRGASTRPLT